MKHLKQFLDKLFLLAFFLLNEKKVTLFLFTKKVTSKIWKIIVQFNFLPICGKIFERLIFNEMFHYDIHFELYELTLSSCFCWTSFPICFLVFKKICLVSSSKNTHHLGDVNLPNQLNVCFYHVTYVFYSESTLSNCLNFKKLLAWNSCDIWKLSDCYRTRTHNHLVCKRTLNHSAKMASLAKLFV